MTMGFVRAAGLVLLMAAGPVLAQPAPPEPPKQERGMGGRGMRGEMFAGMSEAGRGVMREAMRAGREDRMANREQVKAARDRMLGVLEADRLDVAALKRAMDDERKAADASHDRRQTAMLAAYQKLSVEDRKAFVAGARATREKMADRVQTMRERMRERRTMRQGGGVGAGPTI